MFNNMKTEIYAANMYLKDENHNLATSVQYGNERATLLGSVVKPI